MMAATTPLGPRGRAFTVRGQRVLVVGAARSGLAAAELLVARGASVTQTACARLASRSTSAVTTRRSSPAPTSS
jgi:UDP-N-acetylmuramoylalanine-D-glutamate ligase